MFWRELKSFFYFRPKEKRGILVLSFFCLIVLIWRSVPFKEGVEVNIIIEEDKHGILDTFPCLNLRSTQDKELFDFGLTQKQIRTIRNFEKKVRPIKSFDDLNSLYNFDSDLINRLGSSLNWELMNPNSPVRLRLDLNKMTAKDFKSHFGLTQKISNRIIAYRRLLGGYYDLNQLCEVYYFPCSKIGQFSGDKIELHYSMVKRLSLNNSTFETLSKHPYMNKDQCKAIIEYRTKLNRLMNLRDLSNIEGFTKPELKKLKPYLGD